jgi:hypothetical protein
VQTMHRSKQVKQWMRLVAAKIWQQTRPLMTKVASLLKETKPQHVHDLIPPLSILMGAAAFGWWWQSFAAALFAGIPLFFLAGIYKTTERTLAAVQRSEGEERCGNRDAGTLAEPTPENSDALNEAISCLKPWLANEVSLTEENAKECCAVLLASVAGGKLNTNSDLIESDYTISRPPEAFSRSPVMRMLSTRDLHEQ